MESLLTETTRRSSCPRLTTVTVDFFAHDGAPIHPFLVAMRLELDVPEQVEIVLHPVRTRTEMIERIRTASCSFSVLSASVAVRAIAQGLAANVVGATVADADVSHIEAEPSIPWCASDEIVHNTVRSVFVVPREKLSRPTVTVIAAALHAYWRGAHLAAARPGILASILQTEHGYTPAQASLEAMRSLCRWHLEPSVRLDGLCHVLVMLVMRGDIEPVSPRSFLDERFYSAV